MQVRDRFVEGAGTERGDAGEAQLLEVEYVEDIAVTPAYSWLFEPEHFVEFFFHQLFEPFGFEALAGKTGHQK